MTLTFAPCLHCGSINASEVFARGPNQLETPTVECDQCGSIADLDVWPKRAAIAMPEGWKVEKVMECLQLVSPDGRAHPIRAPFMNTTLPAVIVDYFRALELKTRDPIR